MYVFLADVVAGLHVAYVLAVVLGLVLALVGKARGWQWVGNRWFRAIHLAMIVGVVIRAVLGVTGAVPAWRECPLSTWERNLRELDGGGGSAVGIFLHDVIHPSTDVVPMWVYPPLYVAFAVVVVWSFWLVPVRWRKARAAEGAGELTLASGDEAA